MIPELNILKCGYISITSKIQGEEEIMLLFYNTLMPPSGLEITGLVSGAACQIKTITALKRLGAGITTKEIRNRNI